METRIRKTHFFPEHVTRGKKSNIRGGGGKGKLQGETHVTSFPWTTNEKEVYICFIDKKLKF